MPKILTTRFFKYCIIGCSGACIDFIIYTILTLSFNINYLIANALSVSFGITNNFFFNTFFNFKKKDKLYIRFISFYTVGILGLFISEAVLYILIHNLQFDTTMSKIISIFIITIIQYLLNKYITFQNYQTEGTEE